MDIGKYTKERYMDLLIFEQSTDPASLLLTHRMWRLLFVFPREMSSRRNCGLSSVWRIWTRTGSRKVRHIMRSGIGLKRSTDIG